MLKAIAIFAAIAIAVACATGLLGYSSCQQSPEYNSEASKTEKNYEKYCTSPYRVFTVGLFDIKEFIHENRDDINAVSTIFIAAFTIILGLFTISLAGSTRIAAKAADLSARAAIALELPIIRANAAKLASQPDVKQGTTGKQHYVCSVNELRFSNHGRTTASLIEVQFGLTIGNRLPKKPAYRYTKPFPFNAILDSDPKIFEDVFLHQYDFEAPPDLYDQLRTRKTNLWFYCNLVYLDFMDAHHEVGFCWKQHETSGMGILRPDATPAYNRRT